MIAILKQSASNEAVGHIVSWIEKKGLKTDVSRGENETIIGLVGDTTKIDPFLLESMDVVERVQRVSEPFKRANRKFHPEDSVIDCGHGVKIGGDQFQVIAGPCSVEGENLIRIARRVKAAGATMLRGGAYKPRTSPYAYQGMGPAGLDLLCEASAELDMPIVTEIMDPRDVQVFLDKKIDVMQIGARNAQNFPLLKEVGKTQTPILLKRGMSGTIDELLMAAEYIMSEGNDNVILCERGIRTFETRTRNTFDLNAVPVLHHLSHLPVVADPSHATGYTRYVEPMALAATACGANGLEIEVHDEPSRAWSDGAQALTPDQFDDTMRRIRAIREVVCQETMGTVRNARVNQGGPKCAGIVGLGLIGGSFARGYAQAGVRVLAWDPDDDVMTAASMGTVAGELNDKTLGECDIIVLACYPEACIEWLEAHAQALADVTDTEAIMGPVVIDTVGVKGIVCERAFELAREHGFYFVGAHPMAGTQYSGYAHSRADLFQGAPLVLVPPAVDDALKLELLGQVREMVRPLGFGKFSVTSAAEHDRVIAFTSQLAHVVSNAYVKSPTAQVHHGFSAGSYRDLTRVAHLNPQMWSELMIDDADALAFEIDHLIESLGAYSRALKDLDQRYLENLLAEGDRIKRALDDEASH